MRPISLGALLVMAALLAGHTECQKGAGLASSLKKGAGGLLKKMVAGGGGGGGGGGGKSDEEKVDESSSIDLRDTNCLSEPLDQGAQCDGSYALAAAALFEYLYCRIHKTRVRFSAQYIIDCGEPFGLRTCKAGNSFHSVAKLSHLMGFELASEYGYEGAHSAGCPHSGPDEAAEAGFIKAAEQRTLVVPQSEWALWLARKVPLQLTLKHAASLKASYKGGVIRSDECASSHQHQHQVLLVGQGNEAGQDYWLMRASFGPKWGEAGHFKLAKGSGCFENEAVAYTVDAFSKLSGRKATLNSNFFKDNPTYNGDKPRKQRAPTEQPVGSESNEAPRRKSAAKTRPSEPGPVRRAESSRREEKQAPQPPPAAAQRAPAQRHQPPSPQPERDSYNQAQHGRSTAPQQTTYYNSNYNHIPDEPYDSWHSSSAPRSYIDEYGYGATPFDDHPVDSRRAEQGWYYDRGIGCEARVVQDSWG